MKKLVGAIDLTPSWTAVLHLALTILEDPNQREEVKESMRIELRRLAAFADKVNEKSKPKK